MYVVKVEQGPGDTIRYLVGTGFTNIIGELTIDAAMGTGGNTLAQLLLGTLSLCNESELTKSGSGVDALRGTLITRGIEAQRKIAKVQQGMERHTKKPR